MAELKPCKCGGVPVFNLMASIGGTIYIADVRCDKCKAEERVAYLSGRINKPKNAAETAKKLVTKKWNRREAGE